MERVKVKLTAGPLRVPVELVYTGGRIEFHFPYNKPLMEEVRVMAGSKYHGYDAVNPRKMWSVDDSPRNRFQIAYLSGENVYANWDQPLKEFPVSRKEAYKHQQFLVNCGLTYHYAIFAAEMGTGKTLAAIEVMEKSGFPDWLWIGPRSALTAVRVDFKKWGCKITPVMRTYDELVKIMKGWSNDVLPPHGVIFDESSKGKNHMTQRAQAMQHLADNIRETWSDRGFVIEMSGSPAPKSPVDWWSQCEIAAPGYIREGRIDKFRSRLALFMQRETGAGTFPQLVTWWDDENKCQLCGKLKDNPVHTDDLQIMGRQETNGVPIHPWQKSKNEVAYLYQRMKGLVHVLFKKDCLDLPDKIYRVIFCPPTRETMNAAKMITARMGKGVKALIHLRELSDGFQYQDVEIGTETCELCDGKKTTVQEFYVGPDFSQEDLEKVGVEFNWQHPDCPNHPEWWERKEAACTYCLGSGEQKSYRREVAEVECPKDKAFLDLLDEHEEVGRIVAYGGFTGSVDRLIKLCEKAHWDWIRIDGRGWHCSMPECTTDDQMLEAFQSGTLDTECPRIAIIAQPDSAGMGLNLTASPSIVYFSNSFGGEGRIQSEDRIHRPGMDYNRGATIYDIVHLHTDKMVMDNLRAKRDLQSMSLGQLAFMIEKAMQEGDRVV